VASCCPRNASPVIGTLVSHPRDSFRYFSACAILIMGLRPDTGNIADILMRLFARRTDLFVGPSSKILR
jgi:hypothetical protein